MGSLVYSYIMTLRFCLSYRDVEELLLIHGVVVTYEAIRNRNNTSVCTKDLEDSPSRQNHDWRA